MHPDVYRHFMKLVIAVEISIDYSIEYQQVDRIRKLLVEYVSEYEDLYYRREQGRVSACLSTFHFLLHLADNSLDCGPSWVYWQFPYERLCGMLKAKVKSRVSANKNLALAILYEEQLNHLPFACLLPDEFIPAKEAILASRNTYVDDTNYQGYAFLRPKKHDQLSKLEFSHLAQHYSMLLECPQGAVTSDPDFTKDVIKWGRCRLTGNPDLISAAWYETRRAMVPSSRRSSTVRYSLYTEEGHREHLRTYYGSVLFFFQHTYRDCTRMLVYVEQQKVNDLSREPQLRYLQPGNLVRCEGQGRGEVLCVTALDAC